MRIIVETGYIRGTITVKDGDSTKTVQKGGWVSSDNGSLYAVYPEGHPDKAEAVLDSQLPGVIMDAIQLARSLA